MSKPITENVPWRLENVNKVDLNLNLYIFPLMLSVEVIPRMSNLVNFVLSPVAHEHS